MTTVTLGMVYLGLGLSVDLVGIVLGPEFGNVDPPPLNWSELIVSGLPPLSWSTVNMSKTEDQRWRTSGISRKRLSRNCGRLRFSSVFMVVHSFQAMMYRE